MPRIIKDRVATNSVTYQINSYSDLSELIYAMDHQQKDGTCGDKSVIIQIQNHEPRSIDLAPRTLRVYAASITVNVSGPYGSPCHFTLISNGDIRVNGNAENASISAISHRGNVFIENAGHNLDITAMNGLAEVETLSSIGYRTDIKAPSTRNRSQCIVLKAQNIHVHDADKMAAPYALTLDAVNDIQLTGCIGKTKINAASQSGNIAVADTGTASNFEAMKGDVKVGKIENGRFAPGKIGQNTFIRAQNIQVGDVTDVSCVLKASNHLQANTVKGGQNINTILMAGVPGTCEGTMKVDHLYDSASVAVMGELTCRTARHATPHNGVIVNGRFKSKVRDPGFVYIPGHQGPILPGTSNEKLTEELKGYLRRDRNTTSVSATHTPHTCDPS